MPNWIPITIGTLYEAKIAALVDACSSAAKKAGQADRAPGIIQGVVDEVRNAVASCSANRVDGDETTIPKSLRRACVVMILAQLKGALEEPLTDDERDELKSVERKLGQVAACKLKVEQPDTPVAPPVESGTEIETIAEGNMGNSREDLAGL
jgi:hypothetical protein